MDWRRYINDINNKTCGEQRFASMAWSEGGKRGGSDNQEGGDEISTGLANGNWEVNGKELRKADYVC